MRNNKKDNRSNSERNPSSSSKRGSSGKSFKSNRSTRNESIKGSENKSRFTKKNFEEPEAKGSNFKRKDSEDKPYKSRFTKKKFQESDSKRPDFKRKNSEDSGFKNDSKKDNFKKRTPQKEYVSKPRFKGEDFDRKYSKKSASPELIRLNKYIANAGICSRREADTLIQTGAIKVNGKVVTELGYKVHRKDIVHYGNQKIQSEKLVYILLNKPKDHITTSKDPQNRKTVMHLVKNACHERVYPVGRLDRNTTGLLLLTNDGELTTKLTHPKHGIKKIYHVILDKACSSSDLQKLVSGIKLEDGTVKADKASYVEGKKGKKEIGIELHSGKNRVIRRMMESLGYKVTKLDRVFFGGLTKKGVERGKYRFLNEKEVQFLKMQT